MGCVQLGDVVICAPTHESEKIVYRPCFAAKCRQGRRRQRIRWYPWYGGIMTCLTCGRQTVLE